MSDEADIGPEIAFERDLLGIFDMEYNSRTDSWIGHINQVTKIEGLLIDGIKSRVSIYLLDHLILQVEGYSLDATIQEALKQARHIVGGCFYAIQAKETQLENLCISAVLSK